MLNKKKKCVAPKLFQNSIPRLFYSTKSSIVFVSDGERAQFLIPK